MSTSKIKSFFNKSYKQFISIWNNNLHTFIALCIFLAIVMAILIIYPLCYGTFLNFNTDDIIQYYPYVSGFIDKIKSGNISLYDVNLLAGSSFFSGVYYIPLDIFLGITLLLSYMMPNEIAYCITNMLRITCGAMLIYYVFARKGFRPKVSFIIALIYFSGGITTTYYIFPVFLGIAFYAPLAMLLIDLCVEKKGIYYLLIPLYTLIVILYDFYIAYMLLAFMCIYFAIQMHLTSQKLFLIDKNFYFRTIELLLLIFIGLAMSAFFFVPSVYYILRDSTRASQSSSDFLWLFGTKNDEGIKISFRHYFTQWTNMISANNPHNLGLVKAGDYIREHASLYATAGGLVYLVYFFFIWDKGANKLKFWVVIFNILFCIPLASMIFTFNAWPYVRWFFIPYLINLYAIAMAMNKHNYEFGRFNIIKIFPTIVLIFGIATMVYVLICSPDLYIHYTKDSDYFYPIVIASIILMIIYLALIILAFIYQAFERKVNVIYKIVPIVIFAECIFSLVITFSSVGGTSYLNNKNEMSAQKEHLYSLGYNDNDGYRINLYTKTGKNSTNANILIGNVNHTNFFQSFYNPSLNTYSRIIHNDTRTGWSKKTINGYTLLSGPMYNLKYVVAEKDLNELLLPNELYTCLDIKDDIYYYSLNDCPQFIVYDTVFTVSSSDSENVFIKDLALLKYGFIEAAVEAPENEEEILIHSIYQIYKDNNIKLISAKDAYKEIITNPNIVKISSNSPDSKDFNDAYFVYDMSLSKYSKLLDMDAVYICPTGTITNYSASNYDLLSEGNDEHIYFKLKNEERNEYYYFPFHYNVGYISCMNYEIDSIVVKTNTPNTLMYLYGFNYEIYNEFIERQNQYSNRYFKIDDNKINIRFYNPSSAPKVIKTAYTYSSDWIVSDSKYKTCNINGGFLGIIVPEGVENVDVNLSFEPYGFNSGCKISIVGCIIYLSITIPVVSIIIYKRKRKKKEN
ncbi:MAG: hypothetical protein ACI35S_02335 [Anaeroplasma sp.]